MILLNSNLYRGILEWLVLLLATLCLAQFVIYRLRLERVRKKMASDSRRLLGLLSEVSSLQQDRAQTRFENRIFEEFISQPNLDLAMKLLIERSVSSEKDGFGAWLERQDNVLLWRQFQNLSSGELTSIPLGGERLGELQQSDFQVISAEDLRHHFLYDYLPVADRRRVKNLYVFPVRHKNELTGVFLTTSLYPAEMVLERRISLALRLLHGLESHFHHSQVLRVQESQLKNTRELLELRDITDSHRNSVKELVEMFLACLTRQTRCARSMIVFSRDSQFREIRSVQRVGLRPDDESREAWERDERRLLRIAAHRQSRLVLDAEELELYGLGEPLRSVVVVPLRPKEGTHGMLCLFRHESESFSEDDLRHIEWAAGYLGETLRRSLDLATMEMQASVDPLTGLLNRRVFQEKLSTELQRAVADGTPCSLLLLDLDHFKLVNDELGHLAGDQVLKSVAEVIPATLRTIENLPKSHVARYGGEELAVILPNTPA
jgi:GGDEF domain-containing protein